jgi:hypothetical protein
MNQNLENFWDSRLQTIKQWRRRHPEHAPKLYIISKKIENMRNEYIKNLQEYHYRKSKSKLEKAEKIKKEAEELFNKLSKFELLVSLSK